MQITLSQKEFDEAISLWLKEQGFTPDNYDITTRVIVGRSDYNSTRMEVTLDRKVPETSSLTAMDIQIATGITSAKRFGQGHSDE